MPQEAYERAAEGDARTATEQARGKPGGDMEEKRRQFAGRLSLYNSQFLTDMVSFLNKRFGAKIKHGQPKGHKADAIVNFVSSNHEMVISGMQRHAQAVLRTIAIYGNGMPWDIIASLFLPEEFWEDWRRRYESLGGVLDPWSGYGNARKIREREKFPIVAAIIELFLSGLVVAGKGRISHEPIYIADTVYPVFRDNLKQRADELFRNICQEARLEYEPDVSCALDARIGLDFPRQFCSFLAAVAAMRPKVTRKDEFTQASLKELCQMSGLSESTIKKYLQFGLDNELLSLEYNPEDGRAGSLVLRVPTETTPFMIKLLSGEARLLGLIARSLRNSRALLPAGIDESHENQGLADLERYLAGDGAEKFLRTFVRTLLEAPRGWLSAEEIIRAASSLMDYQKYEILFYAAVRPGSVTPSEFQNIRTSQIKDISLSVLDLFSDFGLIDRVVIPSENGHVREGNHKPGVDGEASSHRPVIRLTEFGSAMLSGNSWKPQGDALESLSRKSPVLTVLPTHEVLLPLYSGVETFAKLGSYADVERIDRMSIFRITRQSLLRAAGEGADLGEALEFLGKHSETQIPDTIKRLFEEIRQQEGEIQVGKAGAYLIFRDRFMAAQAMEKIIPEDIVELKASDNLIILKEGVNIGAVLRALKKKGFLPELVKSEPLGSSTWSKR